MVSRYVAGDADLLLRSDFAAELPVYVYLAQDRLELLYSSSITDILDYRKVSSSLSLSDEGISFLLQSGVIPPPATVYKNLYVLGVGDIAHVSTKNGFIHLELKHEFPFLNEYRHPLKNFQPDENLILELLAEATKKRIDASNSSFVFHSAGKDSNAIALALAEAGWQDQFTLVSHKSKGGADESEVSRKIARQLGFKHQVLYEVDHLSNNHIDRIESFLNKVTFPCVDNVSLAYPLYVEQMPDLVGANIVDGGGNDIYMCTPPKGREQKIFPLSIYASKLSFLRGYIRSENPLLPMVRTPAEWCGMSGFSYADSKKIFAKAVDTYSYWSASSELIKQLDSFDFKTSIRAPIIIAEQHIRKVRNFANAYDSNLVLPFTDENVARFFSTMPEEYLFDRKTLQNKLILRKMLKERIGLDSDKLGKMAYVYDSRSLILNHWEWFRSGVLDSPLWDMENTETLLRRLRTRMNGKGWGSIASGRLIYQLFLISKFSSRFS